jgi:hypothetical protein
MRIIKHEEYLETIENKIDFLAAENSDLRLALNAADELIKAYNDRDYDNVVYNKVVAKLEDNYLDKKNKAGV